MKIKLDLNKNFSNFIEELKEKYGKKFEVMNGFSDSHLNFTDFIKNFVRTKTVADNTIDANANSSTHDVRTMLSDMVKPHAKLISFERIFTLMQEKYGLEEAKEWLEGEWNGRFYMHDATSVAFIPYCYSYDLDKLVEKGLFFINRFKTDAPKHLTTFNDHVLEFISWASTRSSGAVGLPSYLLYSYYFWYNDVKQGFYIKDPEYYRRQYFQKFVFDLNQPYLRVTECAFSNITIMDRNYLIELFGGRTFPNGEFAIDHIEGIIEHQKIFMEVVAQARSETMMTFPVITFSLLYQNGKFVDEEFARWCNKHNMKWFDANFYVGNDVTNLSNCCRLISNTKKLTAFINSIGGTALSIGSVKVNTINLRRIALESTSKEEFIQILRKRVDICIKALDIVRKIIVQNIKDGILPNYTHGLIELDKQYNTVGITSMYEAMEEFDLIKTDEFENKYYSEEALEFSGKILDVINETKDSYNFEYSINVEAIPAERANVVLCQKDNELYKDKKNYFIYSNQWIPLMEKCTLNEKIKLGANLDIKCGGGQITHINLMGDFASEEQAWELLNHITKSGVIYFAYNRKISICNKEHAFTAEICPKCGEKSVDTYSRIVGFLVPFSAYSKERKQEFNERKWHDVSNL
ncbi:MAG: anaerobic ribonucleoside-triphosphate reductase [Candidatus Improbicoccus pseudotrichonymphae]|uniref:Anaerobic ribonucleoside-triphosphate reductase n=1 Tax=Candidatus Improbicoccus pseudotrichonymphae TaxID=3033792 RepID=A0AA48IH42_9FIRM|nr:MAG: anaerobic ribonucleoside-triphosphate reductase [Candidatus Improbicoccus pseudotrichonymphae]